MKSTLFLLLTILTFFSAPANNNTVAEIEMTMEDKSPKAVAFEILKAKCNVCHQKKNKKRVFTIDNMDGFAGKIYKQVFKWKRMPKGRDIKLTKEEYDQLNNWISSLTIK